VFVTLNIYFDNVHPDSGNLLYAMECFELDFLPAELGRFRRRHHARHRMDQYRRHALEGRETVLKGHAVVHKGMFAHSRLLPPELSEMRQIAPNVVIETHINRVQGAASLPDGTPYPDNGNIMTMVFVKSPDGWRIAHAHNGNINKQAAARDPAKSPVRE
jgi:hypothetical protein